MFNNEDLQKHLEESSTVRLQSNVIAEWNMNIYENIKQIGNYRYRPSDPSSLYANVPIVYDSLVAGSYFTDADLSYITVADKIDNSETPILFEKLQVWLGQCEMAKTTKVPMMWLSTKGQQIKIYSQILHYGKENDVEMVEFIKYK